MKINNISPDKHNYLQRLGDIANAPKRLYYIGTLPDHRRPTVAIVGTRKPTAYGRDVTYRIAHALASRGVIVISGLALGVDGIAHRAALDAGGTTLAIIPTGLPTITPRQHRGLADDIVAQGGAVMSEFDTDMPIQRFSFLNRNRLVSGLADVVVITEAAARSGTLNTASHALEQGREVFVVPGNITSPLSAGCNALISQGATPIASVDDIVEYFFPAKQSKSRQPSLALGATPVESAIIAQLSAGERDGDIIQQAIGADASEFNIALTTLELNGTIRSLGANQWALRS